MENGFFDSQQQSQCYIKTTRGKARPQDVQIKDRKLCGTKRVSCVHRISILIALLLTNFLIQDISSYVWCGPIRYFVQFSVSDFASTILSPYF